MRESRKHPTDINAKRKALEDMTELKIPENLKILPNDSITQRQAKKKKIKALKQSFKIALINKEAQGKQGEWM